MDKSQHVISFSQSKTNSGCREQHASTAVRFHVEGSYKCERTKMNANESAPPHLLMQNVRDIRKRLMETEKTLNTLTKAEARLDNE